MSKVRVIAYVSYLDPITERGGAGDVVTQAVEVPLDELLPDGDLTSWIQDNEAIPYEWHYGNIEFEVEDDE